MKKEEPKNTTNISPRSSLIFERNKNMSKNSRKNTRYSSFDENQNNTKIEAVVEQNRSPSVDLEASAESSKIDIDPEYRASLRSQSS